MSRYIGRLVGVSYHHHRGNSKDSDADSIRRILHVRRSDCVPSVGLRHRLICIPVQHVQRRLRWCGHAARRSSAELMKDLLLPTPPRTWRRRTGGQLKTWATKIKADLGPISGPRAFGYARWRKDWMDVSSELAQGRQAWSASVRDVVNSIGDAGSTRRDCRHKCKLSNCDVERQFQVYRYFNCVQCEPQ